MAALLSVPSSFALGNTDASKNGAIAQSQLPNGLRIILLEDHSYPVVACFAWYHVGARDEPTGETGLSHVLEHMLFRNVGSFQKGNLGITLSRNGAQYNGYTSDDFTTFYEVMHPAKLEVALKAESARMRGATFSDADLKQEISRVEKELDAEARDPLAVLTREVRASAFRQHPYRNPVIGWRSDLEHLTTADVKEFYDKYYYPNNAALVLVGNFKSVDALTLISKYFAGIPRSSAALPVMRTVEDLQTAERRVIMHNPGKAEAVTLSYHAPRYADPDAPATVVLEKLLNSGSIGRLKTKLIETKTCSNAHCVFQLQKDPGLFTISLNAYPNVGTNKVLEAWDALVTQLRTQPVSDAELRRARSRAEFALIDDRDGPYKMGMQLGFCNALSSWQSANEWIDRIRSVSAADVERVAKRYFSSENRVVGFLNSTAPKPPPHVEPMLRPPVTKQTPAALAPFNAGCLIGRALEFARPKIYAYKGWTDREIVAQASASSTENELGITSGDGKQLTNGTMPRGTLPLRGGPAILPKIELAPGTVAPAQSTWTTDSTKSGAVEKRNVPNSSSRTISGAAANLGTAGSTERSKSVSSIRESETGTATGTSSGAGTQSATATGTFSGAGTQSATATGTSGGARTQSATATGTSGGAGTQSSTATGTSSGAGTQSPTATGTSSGAGTQSPTATGTSSGAGTQSSTATGTSSGAGTQSATATGTSSGAGTQSTAATGTSSGAGTQSATASGTSSGAGTQSSTATGTSSGAGTQSSTATGTSSGAGTQSVTAAITSSAATTHSASESGTSGSAATPATPAASTSGASATQTAASSAPSVPPDTSLPVRERLLGNGIKLIMVESHLSPIVHITGVLRAGSAFEPSSKKGSAAVLTTLFNNGSAKIPKAQMTAQQEDLGLPNEAMLKYDCDPQFIRFQTRCLSRDLARQMALISSIIRDPAFTDADVEHAKQESSAHIKRVGDSASAKVERAFLRSVIAPSSAYIPPDPADLAKSIGGLKTADIKEFHQGNVAPESCTIAIAGDIDPDVAARITEQAFTPWTKSATFKLRPLPNITPNPRKVLKSNIFVSDKGKSVFCVGKLVPLKSNDQNYSYLMLSDCALLNHPLFARLPLRMDQDTTLSQSMVTDDVDAKLAMFPDTTAWSISFPMEASTVSRATSVVQAELRQFARSGIGASELNEAKRYLINSLPVRKASTTKEVAETCLNGVLAGSPPDVLKQETQDLEQANLDSVNRFIKMDFRPDDSTVVIAGTREVIKGARGIGYGESSSNGHVANIDLTTKPKLLDRLLRSEH